MSGTIPPSSSSTNSAASNHPVPLVDLRKVDVNVVVEVFKVLAKLLGPDFAVATDSEAAGGEHATDSKHPFRLTITAAQQHHATLALLKVAAIGSASTGQDVALDSGEAKRQEANAQLVVLPVQQQNMVDRMNASVRQMDVSAPAAESDAVPNPAKRRRLSEEGDSLHAAAKRNDVQTVLNLLNQHHDPYAKDADGRLPIQLASSKAVWGAFASKMHSMDQSFFVNAVERGDGVATRLLIAGGADPATRDSDNVTAFHIAAGEGERDVLEALLDSVGNCTYFFDLTAKGTGPAPGSPQHQYDVLTPLEWACLSGQAGTARLLLERGADVEGPQQSDEMQALHFAACSGKADVVKLLLDYGADVLAVDQNSWTALHFAAELGHVAVCDVLLQKDASILEQQDDTGMTALHKAVFALKHEVVRTLVHRGADINAEDDASETPCDIARDQPDRRILALLLESAQRPRSEA
ncbi:hypothetical protein HDU96_009912 [Phlyctochytrium bullatum]|nr:hypothetical protein HDU96_009912 [Phlyctochytrium bullatum]